MAALEEQILNKVKKKPSVPWRYIGNIFCIWKHGEESLKWFINEINSFHPTIKFTADWAKEKVKVTLKNVYFQPICLLSLLKHINSEILLPATFIIVKKAYLIAKY